MWAVYAKRGAQQKLSITVSWKKLNGGIVSVDVLDGSLSLGGPGLRCRSAGTVPLKPPAGGSGLLVGGKFWEMRAPVSKSHPHFNKTHRSMRVSQQDTLAQFSLSWMVLEGGTL